jgi:2-polyprenyl-6-methoxyphenol hydroxylase-like FAD-dependent oxidoreductase
VDRLRDWHQLAFLSVEASRCRRWYKPGLLLIGDAAHVMSPAGGIGINYAIQDAVAAANRLAGPLLKGEVPTRDLAAVQRRREWVTRLAQAVQAAGPRRALFGAGRPGHGPGRLPWLVRLLPHIPVLRPPARRRVSVTYACCRPRRRTP